MTVFTLHCREAFGASASDLGLMFSTIGLCYVVGMHAPRVARAAALQMRPRMQMQMRP